MHTIPSTCEFCKTVSIQYYYESQLKRYPLGKLGKTHSTASPAYLCLCSIPLINGLFAVSTEKSQDYVHLNINKSLAD